MKLNACSNRKTGIMGYPTNDTKSQWQMTIDNDPTTMKHNAITRCNWMREMYETGYNGLPHEWHKKPMTDDGTQHNEPLQHVC